jgi:hypothetical protein
MKLYATTTSERASKGQGGNDFIEILVQDENQKALYKIIFMPHYEGYITIEGQKAYIHKRSGGGYEGNYTSIYDAFLNLKDKSKGKKQ